MNSVRIVIILSGGRQEPFFACCQRIGRHLRLRLTASAVLRSEEAMSEWHRVHA